MALYLGNRNRNSGIKRVAIAVLGSIIAAGMLVLGFFALTAALAVAAVAFLVGSIWWKFGGKKRFHAATRQAFNGQAFNGSANADDFMRAPSSQGHPGRVIEGEVVRRD